MALSKGGAGAVLAAAGLWAAAAGPVAAQAPARPLLLELFTSQSCSSCPPADALLGELAGRAELLALSFHVDYWNGLGWVDRFATPAFTARQEKYAARHGFQVYTPQLVVDGTGDVVGSDRAGVSAAIARAQQAEQGVPAGIRREGSTAMISVGTAANDVQGQPRAEVLLLSFDPSRSADIRGGENAGRRVAYTNVVRSLRRIAQWRNQPLSLTEPLRAEESGERLALVVQDERDRVWAVAVTP